MQTIKKKSWFHPTHVTGITVIVLALGLVLSLYSVQQNQEQRSRAAGIFAGNFNGTVSGNGFIIGGSVTGDVIGSSNTIGGNVAGCVQGNNNIIGGYVSGSVTGSGNIIAGGHGNGPCLSLEPTPTPTPFESEPSEIPTLAPTNTPVPTARPTATPVPTAVPTNTPTPTQAIPTSTPTPEPSLTPAVSPSPTVSPAGGDTVADVTVFLHGIGKGGDSASPNSTGNTNPLHPQRTITVDVYDVQNQLVTEKQSTVSYVSADGDFTGTVDFGSQFVTGFYTIKIKTDQYLRAAVPGIQTITEGQTVTLPAVTLVTGDVNGDNQINIVDYNLLIGCYSDLLPAVDCTPANNVLTDLNDDGHVNQFDYNLFLRELTNIGGQ